MKIRDIKIEQNRERTNKTDRFGVWIDFEVDISVCEDYVGKNPHWAIFYIDGYKEPYFLRWMDYDGWRSYEEYFFKTFDEASRVLKEQILLEGEMIVSRGGVPLSSTRFVEPKVGFFLGEEVMIEDDIKVMNKDFDVSTGDYIYEIYKGDKLVKSFKNGFFEEVGQLITIVKKELSKL